MSLVRELQRRNVIRVATAYAVTAWLVIQVIETIVPAFGFGDAAVRITVIVLAIGFIPAVIGAWVFEWTPEGLKRDSGEQQTGDRARNFDRGIIVVLVLAVSFFAFDKFVLAPERAVEREAEVAEQARVEALTGFYGDRSIAVLPFDNLSSDPEQVYFVDGVAEEILNLLARIRDLRVISRSSSFAFRDQALEIPDIAERLDVAHVLEGSVRRAGNRVRVTAQLIEARTDTHLWSKTYDRELDDVFLIQDEIAADVVRNLELTLQRPLPHSREVDPEVMALVQQAKQVFEIRGPESASRMHTLLTRALEIDPDYVPALEWMRIAYFLLGGEGAMSSAEVERRWKEIRARLLQLEPDSAWVDFSDAWDSMQAGRWERAAELFRQGLEKDLSSSLNVRAAGMFAQSMGKLDVAERLLRHAVAIDPLCYQCLRILSQILMYRGKIDSALEIRSRYLAIGAGGQPDYSMMLILSGRPEKVAGLWAEAPDESYQKQAYLAFADHAMGDDDSVNTRLERMESQLAAMYEAGGSERDQANLPHNLALVYAWVGDADRAFELLIPLARQEGVESLKGSLFHPVWREIRDDPRWEEYRAALGMSEKRFAAIEFDPSLPE